MLKRVATMTTDQPDTSHDDAQADQPQPVPTEPQQHKKQDQLPHTRASGMWVGSIVAAIVMIFLLVFIVQNNESVEISFLMFDFTLPLGVALLLAAISAVLVVAVPGAVRIMQLRRKLTP
jgi:uncharacterized integral membrane protein